MAIIGSREQLCIHPEVSKKETNFEKVIKSIHVTILMCVCVYVCVCVCVCVGSLV